jgi:hypothetical protein
MQRPLLTWPVRPPARCQLRQSATKNGKARQSVMRALAQKAARSAAHRQAAPLSYAITYGITATQRIS